MSPHTERIDPDPVNPDREELIDATIIEYTVKGHPWRLLSDGTLQVQTADGGWKRSRKADRLQIIDGILSGARGRVFTRALTVYDDTRLKEAGRWRALIYS